MENLDKLSLNQNAEVGDTMYDNRDKTYFKVTGLSKDNKIAIGYRYAPDSHLQSEAQRERHKEADIVLLMDLVMHYKKAGVKF